MRTLHELPRFDDRWSYLYLEMGTLDQTAGGLCFHNEAGVTPIPIDQLSLVMLGPGTTVTHAAVKALAGNNCLLAWTGYEGMKLYAHSTGGTFSSRRLLRQARAYADEGQRLAVVRRMYAKRFPESDLDGKTLQQIRGMEGIRVRQAYEKTAASFGLKWEGRRYDQGNWDYANPANRALSAANACLYGVCYAAILSAGYSPSIGFIHTGKMLSFVYDVGDLYKTELTIPVAFAMAATVHSDLERAVRMECRSAFHEFRLMERILPDLAEVMQLDGDDSTESDEDLEGHVVPVDDRTFDWSVRRESECPGP